MMGATPDVTGLVSPAGNGVAFFAEASSLGLPPGWWPENLILSGVVLVRSAAVRSPGGDLVEVRYEGGGFRLLVFND